MITIYRWTGLEAKLLRQALRFSVRGFAEHLGVGMRTINKWEARLADITLRPHMQEILDTALARASEEAQARFGAVAHAGAPALKDSPEPTAAPLHRAIITASHRPEEVEVTLVSAADELSGPFTAAHPPRSHHRFPTPCCNRRSESLNTRTLMTETEQEMRDHWWWRPGWRVGRSFYTWHVTFENQPAAHQLAADYALVLDDLPTLDPIPVRWLHLTMQGIGFTDEVDRADIDAIVAAARNRCAAMAPFTITLGPARVDPEALMLPVRPTESVVALRTAIRAAIADVWGPDNVPENPHGFHPHVSLAYSNDTGPAEPITQRLTTQPMTSAKITVHRVALIDLNNDHRIYEWTDVATVELSTPTI